MRWHLADPARGAFRDDRKVATISIDGRAVAALCGRRVPLSAFEPGAPADICRLCMLVMAAHYGETGR